MGGVLYGEDRLTSETVDDRKLALGLDRRVYITVHNGYDANMVVSLAWATKCYPHFGEVIKYLRQIRGDILFVQVGIHTSEPIAETDLQLIDTTSLRSGCGSGGWYRSTSRFLLWR